MRGRSGFTFGSFRGEWLFRSRMRWMILNKEKGEWRSFLASSWSSCCGAETTSKQSVVKVTFTKNMLHASPLAEYNIWVDKYWLLMCQSTSAGDQGEEGSRSENEQSWNSHITWLTFLDSNYIPFLVSYFCCPTQDLTLTFVFLKVHFPFHSIPQRAGYSQQTQKGNMFGFMIHFHLCIHTIHEQLLHLKRGEWNLIQLLKNLYFYFTRIP